MFHAYRDLIPLLKRRGSQQASFIRGLYKIRMMYYSIRWQLRKTACPVCVFQELSVSTCLMSLHSVLWWIPGQKALERANGVYKRESLSAGMLAAACQIRHAKHFPYILASSGALPANTLKSAAAKRDASVGAFIYTFTPADCQKTAIN